MQIYVIQGLNRVRQVDAEIEGELAKIPLPFGAFKVVKRPRWWDTQDEAMAHVEFMRLKRIKSLKRQLRSLTK